MSDLDVAVRAADADVRGVVITDVEIPFTALIILIMKIALAAIPAIFIVLMVLSLLTQVVNGIFDGPVTQP